MKCHTVRGFELFELYTGSVPEKDRCVASCTSYEALYAARRLLEDPEAVRLMKRELEK